MRGMYLKMRMNGLYGIKKLLSSWLTQRPRVNSRKYQNPTEKFSPKLGCVYTKIIHDKGYGDRKVEVFVIKEGGGMCEVLFYWNGEMHHQHIEKCKLFDDARNVEATNLRARVWVFNKKISGALDNAR